MGEIEEIIKYRTSDGNEHFSKEYAEQHERFIEKVDEANNKYWDGCSLYEALELAGFTNIPESFKGVNQETKLAIPHWQCRDEPGYCPIRLTYDRMVEVYGDAGAWSGSYGNKMSINGLQRYVECQKEEEN